MKRRFGLIIWGLAIAAFGVGWIGDIAGWWSGWWSFFGKAWWPLLIIILALWWICDKGPGTFKLIVLFGGVYCLFAQLMPSDLMWRLIWPVLIVFCGLLIVFSSRIFRFRRVNREDGMHYYIPVYSGVLKNRTVNYGAKAFTGADVSTVFGAITLDLRDANFADDALIDINAVFAPVKVILPETVKVNAKCSKVFGKLKNETVKNDSFVNLPVVHVTGAATFADIELTFEGPVNTKTK